MQIKRVLWTICAKGTRYVKNGSRSIKTVLVELWKTCSHRLGQVKICFFHFFIILVIIAFIIFYHLFYHLHFLIIFLTFFFKSFFHHFSSFLLPVVQKKSKKWKITIFLEFLSFFFNHFCLHWWNWWKMIKNDENW